MAVLVAYASKHGSTQGVAEAIGAVLQESGRQADVLPISAGPDPAGYEAVVLGSAIYYGSWLDDAYAFCERHRAALAQRPLWLFSVGPLGTEVEDKAEQPHDIDELRQELRPRDHRVFFGALDREGLGFKERMVVKAVRAPEGDFRDWDEIRAWATGIAGQLG